MNGRTIFGPLGFSLLALFALTVVVIAQVPPLVAAVFTPGVEQVALGKQIESLVAEHQKEREIYEARFDGRSAFFDPPAPRIAPRGSTPPPHVEQIDYGPAEDYAGPLKATGVRDKVIFASGNSAVTLGVGEERQGVRLVSIDGPFWVTVAWTAPPTERYRYSEGNYQIPVWEWPGGLFTSIPPLPGMASEMVVPTPPVLEEGSPRGNPNDAREMVRRRAEEIERRNREREADEDDEEGEGEDAEEDVEEEDEVIDDEEVDDGEVDDEGEIEEDEEAEDDGDPDGDGDGVEDDDADGDGEDDGTGDGESDDGTASGDDDEENRR